MSDNSASPRYPRRSARLYNKEHSNSHRANPANLDFSRILLSQMKSYPDVHTPLLNQLCTEIKKLNSMLSGKTKLTSNRKNNKNSEFCRSQCSSRENFSLLVPPSKWVYSTPKREKSSADSKQEKTQLPPVRQENYVYPGQGFAVTHHLMDIEYDFGQPFYGFDNSNYNDNYYRDHQVNVYT